MNQTKASYLHYKVLHVLCVYMYFPILISTSSSSFFSSSSRSPFHLVKTGSHCILQKVSITITSEVWNNTLLDRESFDYKTLETSVLTAVSCLNIKAIILTEA